MEYVSQRMSFAVQYQPTILFHRKGEAICVVTTGKLVQKHRAVRYHTSIRTIILQCIAFHRWVDHHILNIIYILNISDFTIKIVSSRLSWRNPSHWPAGLTEAHINDVQWFTSTVTSYQLYLVTIYSVCKQTVDICCCLFLLYCFSVLSVSWMICRLGYPIQLYRIDRAVATESQTEWQIIIITAKKV